MIEEPPQLTLHTSRNRPNAAQIEAFRGVPVCFVTDALGGGGALGGNICPLDASALPASMCGSALTVQNGPGDILATLGALSEITPGDVVVIGTGGWQGCAVAGDRVLGMMKNCGAAGMITDGPVRDLSGLIEVGLPVFCTGLNPNTPFTTGPGTVGCAVEIGGQHVASGDIVVADRDGIAVVPFDRIDETIVALAEVMAAEAGLDAEVRAGLKVPGAIVELLASDRVRRI